MFHSMTSQKKLMAQPLSGLGLRLAEEEHEQKDDDLNQLLVAQLKLDCQFQHGISPVYAGSAANWLGLAICYTPLHGVALGLPRMALSGSKGWPLGSKLCGLRFYRGSTRHTINALRFLTLSRVVARQLGLLAQVRYPARGSARVTPLMKHNVGGKGPAGGGTPEDGPA